MSATTKLGRVGLVLRGAYDAAAAYSRMDVVTYEGCAYAALKDTTDSVPTDAACWQPLADIRPALEDMDGVMESAKSAEQTRASGEAERQAAEQERAGSEAARLGAEQTRVDSENARQAAEQTRSGNEAVRLDAEQTRSGNEDARQTAEQTRIENEAERQTAESSRASAEESRAAAETERSDAEQERVAAEQLRESAEAERKETFAGYQGEIDGVKADIFYKLGFEKSINLLSYRPLGVLRKGYICLSSDDGTGQLAMYTIPKIKELREKYKKPISVTFSVFSASSVFQNEEYKALVQEMLTSYYKCSIAIHGVKKFTDYSDDELISYLDTQAEELTELCGVAPTSIVYPEHAYNVRTSTIAGAYYGVCCTGGSNWPIVYDYSTSGERSNLYTLFRYSLFGNSTSFETKKTEIKNMIDYCADNHKICLPFFHDFDFTSDKGYWTKEQCMELFEYCVQYVVSKAGAVEFINIGDIPKLR